MTSAIRNFQIPVIDFGRALHFYNQLMGYPLEQMILEEYKLGIFRFDMEKGGTGGCIISSDDMTPSKAGTLVYLNAEPDLQMYLDRMEPSGSIHMGKSPLGPGMGYFAIIEDSEGNRVGLFSNQ